MCCGESVVQKCWDECCREVLGKRGVEKVLGRVFSESQRSGGIECCREQLQRSVAEKCWEECCGGKVGEKCWGGVLRKKV